MLETNADFEKLNGYRYIAAATSKVEYYSEDESGHDVTENIAWGNRSDDDTNAVYLSELFNISQDTIIETGKANAAVMKMFTMKDSNGYDILDEHGNVQYINAIDTDSLNAFYRTAMADMGVRATSIDTRISEHEAVMTQIQNWRDSVSGVDWNEELTNMIKFQKGYSSCARCLSAMDEMLDRLINNTGVVGR